MIRKLIHQRNVKAEMTSRVTLRMERRRRATKKKEEEEEEEAEKNLLSCFLVFCCFVCEVLPLLQLFDSKWVICWVTLAVDRSVTNVIF